MLTEPDPNSGNMAEEPSTPTTEGFCMPLNEQRHESRFQREAGTDSAVIWKESGKEHLVEVHDESLTGLCILVGADLDFQLGNHVHVIYAGEYLQGEVRHITMQPEGKYLLGLRCQRIPPEEAE